MRKFLSFCYLLTICTFPFLCVDTYASESHAELIINRQIINHRFGLHAIGIHLTIDGKEVPSPKMIKDEINIFLTSYPNQEDYWEIVNKKLVIYLANKYSSIEQMQSIFSVEPDLIKPFNRKSIVSLKNQQVEREAFLFTIANQTIQNDLASIEVEMEYKPEVTVSDYINFFAVKDAIQAYFRENSSLNASEFDLSERLAKHLLIIFPNVQSFGISLNRAFDSNDSANYLWKTKVFHSDLDLNKFLE
ncbi:hypothetical protein [Parachlamydia acanthamoebae]|uniref:Uncharacterized protein n=2 Tax=Parachlamydia acanthamoebae TaxID=83552 RepID=F8L134_PARAV|nr:hypothetical protein [Parachlamydia acanthamoebae]KIA77364.1 hypothetical protein DB43_GL00250 [Parachlamydia acanthamoebae]CCB86953.1 putative uncharacterized protein [Parachlamydia acanthamoebae UV-7]